MTTGVISAANKHKSLSLSDYKLYNITLLMSPQNIHALQATWIWHSLQLYPFTLWTAKCQNGKAVGECCGSN